MPQVGVSVLASGSNGNCIAVHCQDQAVLIDCGISLRQLRLRMAQVGVSESWVKAILITHEHDDHVKGLAVSAKYFGVPVFATRLCAEALRRKGFTGSITLINQCADFLMAGMLIRAFSVQHDASDPVGYVIHKESTKIGICTDFGQPTQMTNFQLYDCSTLVLESNYDLNMLASSSRPWHLKQRILSPIGHISNQENSEILGRVVTPNTRNLVLAHISHECNQYSIAEAAANAQLVAMRRQDITLALGLREQAIPTLWN